MAGSRPVGEGSERPFAPARTSRRRTPAGLYDPADQVRRMQQGGWLDVRGRLWRAPKAFVGEGLALRPTWQDGCFDIVFIARSLGRIDLNRAAGSLQPVTHLPEQLSPFSPV